jgi:hypothetical protein
MKRCKFWLVLAALTSGTATASAQFPNNGQPPAYLRPPALSPYLNLALGRDPAVNYFLGVRSEMNRRTNERLLGNAILDLDRRVTASEPNDLFPTLTGTGHFNFGRPGPPRRGR